MATGSLKFKAPQVRTTKCTPIGRFAIVYTVNANRIGLSVESTNHRSRKLRTGDYLPFWISLDDASGIVHMYVEVSRLFVSGARVAVAANRSAGSGSYTTRTTFPGDSAQPIRSRMIRPR